jgi:hypothetical protein
MSDSKILYHLFLDCIKIKYNHFFKNDSYHLKIYEYSYNNQNLNSFLHLIEACIAKINSKPCKACIESNNILTSTKCGVFNKQLGLFFCTYFGCPLFISENFFRNLKFSVFTSDGMHLFDMNAALINYFKYKNKTNNNQIYFIGTFYEKEDPKIFEENVKFINTCTKFNRYAILATIGTIEEPKHFYAILIDKEKLKIYIYNSCPKTFQNVNELYSKWFPNMNILNNSYQNQYDTMLCGFFSSKFLIDVAYSEDTNTCFERFNHNEKMDDLIKVFQNKLVIPIEEKNNLIFVFLNCW